MITHNSIDHDGQQVEARRDVPRWENTDGWWFVHLGEPDATDDESAGVFDDLFTRIADPARLGARTR